VRPWLATACLAAVFLSACPEKTTPKADPNVVATVNGEVISRTDFEHELSREVQSPDGETTPSPDQLSLYKRTVLDTMVERDLLLQAAKQAGVSATPEDVDRGMMRLSSDFPADGFDDALAEGQLSLAELKQKTADLLTIEKLFDQEVYPRVALTEDEIRRYFDEHEADFQEPEQVHAQQLVVKDLDEAKHVQSLLRQGKKFSELARKYSLSADAKVGGDLGFFKRGVMPPQFDEVAFKLTVGQVSEIVSTAYGFHLFKLLEKKPARKRELAEVRVQVEQRLLQDKRADAQRGFVKALQEKADLKVNEGTLLAITATRTIPSGSRIAEP
jgi:peptidyl-prolyl cis-trans isomerase C